MHIHRLPRPGPLPQVSLVVHMEHGLGGIREALACVHALDAARISLILRLSGGLAGTCSGVCKRGVKIHGPHAIAKDFELCSHVWFFFLDSYCKVAEKKVKILGHYSERGLFVLVPFNAAYEEEKVSVERK